jgi:hypothetical protein
LDHPFRLLELTAPDDDDFPTEFFEVAGMFFIVGDVPLEFFLPEGFVAFRGRGVFTAFVPVPEASMSKDDGFVFGQYDVRLPRQGADVFPEPVSGAVQYRADKNFGFGVFAPDSRHVPASLFN